MIHSHYSYAASNQCEPISGWLTSVSGSNSITWANDQPSDNNKSVLICCSIQWPRIQWPKVGPAIIEAQILNMLTPMLALSKSFEKLVWDQFRDFALGFATYPSTFGIYQLLAFGDLMSLSSWWVLSSVSVWLSCHLYLTAASAAAFNIPQTHCSGANKFHGKKRLHKQSKLLYKSDKLDCGCGWEGSIQKKEKKRPLKIATRNVTRLASKFSWQLNLGLAIFQGPWRRELGRAQ